MIDLRHVDCMEYLATCEDNAFELAIVDPPYMHEFKTGTWGGTAAKQKQYKNREDTLTGKKPGTAYFNELKRVSKNQIVWGGNYFSLPISRGWIFWLKGMQKNYYSDGELAWSSFDKVLKCFDFTWSGMLQGDMKNKEERIHPTQKPVTLYEWLLMNYAKEGDRILDTHLGSGSIAIACHNLGFDLVGCELDEDYYKGACERLERHKAQLRMF